ncbi:hypothetical protein JCM5353_002370 [Sporobolomyces roseus]
MVPYIPPELLRATLDHLDDSTDLARCCTTSKTFLSIAQPLLYKDLELRISENYHLNGSGSLLTRVHIERTSHVLLTTLRRAPRLRQLVQKVGLLGQIGAMVEPDEGEARGVDLEEIVKEIVETFPSATVVNLDNVFHLGDLDGAVHLLQRQRSDGGAHSATIPAFSIVIPGSLGEATMFRGDYERFQWIPFSTVGPQIKVEELLKSSQHTLQRLDIPLDESTSLALFRNLERLALRLSVRTPSNTTQNIAGALVSLPSLRVLMIHGSAQEEDLGNLLQSGILARALPVSLTHVSLDFKLTPSDIAPFLRDLPSTSNLKRFNCLSETGDIEEVMDEFSKRGIRLSFDEDWNLWW